MAVARCSCGSTHENDPERLRAVDATLFGVPEFGPCNLPDGRQYLIQRRYVMFHGISPLEVPLLATRFGWTQTR